MRILRTYYDETHWEEVEVEDAVEALTGDYIREKIRPMLEGLATAAPIRSTFGVYIVFPDGMSEEDMNAHLPVVHDDNEATEIRFLK